MYWVFQYHEMEREGGGAAMCSAYPLGDADF